MKTSILFQPEYFRQSIYDLYDRSGYLFHKISSGDTTTVKIALQNALSNHSEILIIFRPEWLIHHNELFYRLKDQGCKIVGVSTEPVPRDNQNEIDWHPDQLTRLENLLQVNKLPFDLIVHYDESSKSFLNKKIVHPTLYLPLPLSKQLFNQKSTQKESTIEFDSIFLGRSTDYREKYLVVPKTLHRHLHVAHGLTDELSAEFIKKSKVSINIHNLPYSGYEVRVMQSLMCGVPVISELLTRDDMHLSCGLYFFTNFDEFVNLMTNEIIKKPISDEVEFLWRTQYDANDWIQKIIDLTKNMD